MDEGFKKRFNAKWMRDDETDCWNWTGSLSGQGYGQIKPTGWKRSVLAHRASYMIHHGEVPDGRTISHLCQNHACVNPEHLFLEGDSIETRFKTKYVKDEATGCWLWTASTAGKGYGQIKVTGERRQEYAHRVSYAIHHGEIPDGLEVCHTCDTPLCVNPEHLFLGTSADNSADMVLKNRQLAGEKNPSSKLTEKDVGEIVKMLSVGLPQARVAKAYNVHQVTIGRIEKGSRWTHITKPQQ